MGNTYGNSLIIPLVNKSGGAVIRGDVVILDTGNNAAFTTTTSASSVLAIGVVQESIANNATGRVLVSGYADLVNVNASVTRGNYGATYTVAKQATDAGASRAAGTFCQFLTGGTTPTAKVYPVDLAGAALTNPMTTAEDLIVGGASGTPARKAKGAAGGALSVVNGALAYNAGTSFPSAVTGDRYWRTDLREEYFYDGTRWLTTTLYRTDIQPATQGNSATFSCPLVVPALSDGSSDVWLEDMRCSFFISGGTALDASNKWVVTLDKIQQDSVTVTNIGTMATINSGSLNVWRDAAIATIDALVNNGTVHDALQVTWTKTGSPGGITVGMHMTYRMVAA